MSDFENNFWGDSSGKSNKRKHYEEESYMPKQEKKSENKNKKNGSKNSNKKCKSNSGNGGKSKDEANFWFILLVTIVVIASLYLGLWLAGAKEKPIDCPYMQGEDYLASIEEGEKNLFGEDGVRVILAIGVDERKNDIGRSDTIMLAFLHEESKHISVLNIPRDTYVTLADSSKQKTKVNHAYAYGGIELLEKTLESFLGIEIDNYVKVNFNGFVELIDAIGGIEIDVEKDMVTPWENINLKAGLQTLDGEDALGYVRFRGDGQGDIGRIARQQKFIKAVANDMLDMGNIMKLPKIIGIINDNVETDLSKTEILSMITVYKDSLSSDLEMVMLPGSPQYVDRISYWFMESNEIPALVERLFDDKKE